MKFTSLVNPVRFLLIVFMVTASASAQSTAPSPVYRWTTLVGRASVGTEDGPAATARFNNPHGLAMDLAGNLYVADTGNHAIRKISAAGIVSTFAGLIQESGSTDGTGSSARFNSPQGVAVDLNGNVYVADTGNHTVRKITPTGVVTTLAGQAGIKGTADGAAASALFDSPDRLTVDTRGNVYLSNNGVRKISGGQVQTLPIPSQATDPDGKTVTVLVIPCPAVDAAGQLYFATSVPGELLRVDPAGGVTVFRNSFFYIPYSGSYYAAKYAGNAVFNDASGNLFLELSQTAGFIETGNFGMPMETDGTLDATRLGHFTTHWGNKPAAPRGLVVDRAGKWYYTRDDDHAIMSENVPYAGTPLPQEGLDGIGESVRLESASLLTTDISGNVWVAENPVRYSYEITTERFLYSTKLRKIASDRTVTTPLPLPQYLNYYGMYFPEGLASDESGNVHLTEWKYNIQFGPPYPGELFQVSRDATISSLGATPIGDSFGLATGASGKLATVTATYLSYPTRYYRIMQRLTDGTWDSLAGGNSREIKDGSGDAARFDSPYSLTAKRGGDYYLLDAVENGNQPSIECYIRKITSSGTVSTVNKKITGNPNSLAVDSKGAFYLTHDNLGTITKIDATGDEVTIGGLPGKIGSADGSGDQARFASTRSIVVDAQDSLYVVDGFGTTVRKGEYLGNTPGIVTQPQSQTVPEGGSVQFSVAASSTAVLTYQWYFNGSAFNGATGNTLSFSNARSADAGDFTVVVTNSLGSVTSNKATLTISATPVVNPAPTPTPASAGGGGSIDGWFALALVALGVTRVRKIFSSE